MKKIEWVQLKNFRNFSYLKIEGLGDVNVIVGKNNTGKSTFLEALFLSLDSQATPSLLRTPLKIIFRKRGIAGPLLSFQNREEFEDFKKLIYNLFFHKYSTSASVITSSGEFKIKTFEIPVSRIIKKWECSSLFFLY